MNIKIIVILLTYGSIISGTSQVGFNPSYDPEDWPSHKVKFSQKGMLKDLFDSGIRPYRFPSLERSTLEFKHVKIIIEMKSGEKLPELQVMLGSITPLQNGLLSSLEVRSTKLTILEANASMLPFLAKGKRTREELTNYLRSAEANPREFDDPYHGDPSGFGIGWDDSDGPAYSVFFKPTFDSNTPVSFVMHVSWGGKYLTPIEERSFYDIPIPPPPGYENVSMDAPRNFGPDSAVEIARSKGIPITGDRTPEEYEKQWRLKNNKPVTPAPKTIISESKQKNPGNSGIWAWLIGIIGFLTAAMLVWRLKPKTSH